uniref:Cysteine-rich DPF motif domain-containing protein 1 n=1 Tax=Timema monikensis TaxID=170555 RepID=A0A7R9HSP4_9NEOP|nr:unnamed protein product [Timema monikensis]
MEAEPPAHIEGGEFVCSTCGLTEHYTYKGKQPPFCKKISFIDDSYIMKDPFSPPNKNQFLLLGSDCHLCNKQVCQSQNCSLFYSKRFCQTCAADNIGYFPVQIQQKLKKHNWCVGPDERRVPRHLGGCLCGSSGRPRRSCLRRGEGQSDETDGPASVAKLANALVVFSSTAEDGEIEVRISVGTATTEYGPGPTEMESASGPYGCYMLLGGLNIHTRVS